MEKTLTYRLTLDAWNPTQKGRIRNVLARELHLSRHEIARLKFDGQILLNGKQVHTDECMRVGDTLKVIFPEEGSEDAVLLEQEPEILLEEDDFLVVNKPAGIPVHPSHGHAEDSLGTMVQSHYLKRNEDFTIRPVGRLDKDVSGVQLFAKNQPAASRLNQERIEGKLRKGYIAFVENAMEESHGTIDAPIEKVEGERAREVSEDGDRAVTHWQCMQVMRQGAQVYSVLFVEIETGRTHQIRTHMASIHHPLLGDELYGGGTELLKRPALHCARINLLSPFTRTPASVRAPLPDDMEGLIRQSQVITSNAEPEIDIHQVIQNAWKDEEKKKTEASVKGAELTTFEEKTELTKETARKEETVQPAVIDETMDQRRENTRRHHPALIAVMLALVTAVCVLGYQAQHVETKLASALPSATAAAVKMNREEELEAAYEAMNIVFKDETELEFAGDFDPLDYVLSSTGAIRTAGTVNTHKAGVQKLDYILRETTSYGDTATKIVSRTFTVKQPVNPVISFRNESITIDLNEDFDPLADITGVTDARGSALVYSDLLKKGTYTVESRVDVTAEGIYDVVIHAMDSDGAESEEAYSVTVAAAQAESEETAVTDVTAPIIVFKADAVSIMAGDDYSLQDNVISIKDDVDGELPYADEETTQKGTWTIDSNAGDLTAPGTYRIAVTAMDKAGNKSSAVYSLTITGKAAAAETAQASAEASVEASVEASAETSAEATAAASESASSAPASSYVADSSDPYGQIYSFLTSGMGLNNAQAIGILANMKRESGYNPQADSGYYYGLCQWGGGRLSSLQSWCAANGYDYTTIDGQLHYLAYEMPSSYPNTTAELRACEDSADGAAQAAYIFCYGYEVGGESLSNSVAETARGMY